jgi:hypothetical protein
MPVPLWPQTAASFPDIELLVCKLYEPLVGPDDVDTITPPDLSDRAYFVRVLRVGGGDDGITDRALVEADHFAPTRGAAIELAGKGRQLLAGDGPNGKFHRVDGRILDKVTAPRGPVERPWSATRNLRRFTVSYEVSARR